MNSLWLLAGSNPADINRVRTKNGKYLLAK